MIDEKNNTTSSTQSEEVLVDDNAQVFTPSVKETEKQNTSNQDSKKFNISRLYINFETRIGLLVIGIAILFGIACFMIVSTLQKYEVKKIDYTEISDIHYNVCTSDSSNCKGENEAYNSSRAANIHVKYHYEARYEEDVDCNLSYYVVAVHQIFDKFDLSKVTYEKEDIISEKKIIHSENNMAKFDIEADVDYRTYRKFVENYKKKYSDITESNLKIILYVSDGSNVHSVGEVIVPLVKDTFSIQIQNSKGLSQQYSLERNNLSEGSLIYLVVGCVLILLSLFLLSRLTKLVTSLTGRKTRYQDYLMFILNEYDRIIVNATDDYEIDTNKKLVKVSSFEELLDIRGVLNKPIVYAKINSVKSEFILTDDEAVYRFILKAADLGE